MYYSKSKREWLDESQMNSTHLLNALLKAEQDGYSSDALRAEVLRRMEGKPVSVTIGGITVTVNA